MNCSFCEYAVPATANAAAPKSVARLIFRNIGTLLYMEIFLFLQVIGMNSRSHYSLNRHGWENRPGSVGKRPQPQFFLGDLQQSRKTNGSTTRKKAAERS